MFKTPYFSDARDHKLHVINKHHVNNWGLTKVWLVNLRYMYSCTAISKPHIHDFRIQIYISPYKEFPFCTYSLLVIFPNDKIALFRNPQKLSKHKTDHNLAAGNDDRMFHPLGDIRELRSTKMSSLLGSNNFWTVLVFIVPHLLWHGISVFLVYPREPPMKSGVS